MKVDDPTLAFSLFGGPLYRLGCRLGLVRGGTNTLGLGVALGLITWGVLVALTLVTGGKTRVFSLQTIGAHVRLLVALPLLFLCETWVFPRMAEFVRDIVRSGIVPEAEWPALQSAIRRIGRLKGCWLAEGLFLGVAFVLPLFDTFIGMPGRTGKTGAILSVSDGQVGAVLVWYVSFCLPLFRFLILRWLWHLALWCTFLWRVQKLNLHLIPTHPDQTAGLGYLEVVHEHFAPLAVAVSMVYSASFAEDIAAGAMAFETLSLMVPLVLLAVAALFIGPLFIFSPKLWVCRITGWRSYMDMASRYVAAFERKWIKGENPSDEPLIGTPDMQSLADLNNSVNVVRAMRWIPAGQRLLMIFAVAVIVPLLPLLLLKYPVTELAEKLLQTLSGL
ncbi:MAG: hypothetical protein WCK89_09570 [bacterium]